MAGNVIFDGPVIGMLAHELDLIVGDDEVDDVVLGIFGYDGSAFDGARKFRPVYGDDALEVTRDDAPIIWELPFDEPRPDVDIAELDGQVIPDRRDFYRFRDIRRQQTKLDIRLYHFYPSRQLVHPATSKPNMYHTRLVLYPEAECIQCFRINQLLDGFRLNYRPL